jgi:hypothetical protein
MLHDSCWQRRLSKLVRAGAVAVFLAVLTTEKAVADDVDTAVDAIALAGTIGNIPVHEGDKAIIKLIVRCAANNSIVECARSQVIDQLQLPPEVKPLADCILDGTPLEDCASKDLLNGLGLPAPVQQHAQQLLACISHTGEVGACANQAVTAGEHQILDVINNLQADARSDAMTELDAAGRGTMRNIISLSKAIEANDWVNVSIYGGPEIYKKAAHIVLDTVAPEIFVTFGLVLNPIIDDIIQARADLLAKVVTAARNSDPHLMGEAITEAYLTERILVPCDLLPDDVKKTLCGPIGKFIYSIADAFGDVTDFAVGLITDPLDIPADILGELTKLLHPDLCPAPDRYYANSYARCYQRGVRQLSMSNAQLEQLVGSLNNRCRVLHYDKCFTQGSGKVDSICNPQQDLFRNHVRQLVSSVNNAARSYSSVNNAAGSYMGLFPQFVREQGRAAACDRQSFMSQSFPRFLDECAAKVQVQVPLLGDPDSDDCDTHPATFFAPVAHRAACERAMAQVDISAILGQVCAPADIVALTADTSLLGETVPPVIIEPLQLHLP